MAELSVREWVAVIAGTVAFFAGAVAAGALSALDALPPWAGWTLALVAIVGLVVMVTTIVKALLRGDVEGVELQNAARASMVTVLVMVVSGFGYSLLEAFAGLPRVTAAVPAAAAGLVWMIVFARGWAGGDEQ